MTKHHCVICEDGFESDKPDKSIVFPGHLVCPECHEKEMKVNNGNWVKIKGYIYMVPTPNNSIKRIEDEFISAFGDDYIVGCILTLYFMEALPGEVEDDLRERFNIDTMDGCRIVDPRDVAILPHGILFTMDEYGTILTDWWN